MKANKHIGSSLEDFLQDEGIFEEVEAVALKRMLVLKILDVMKKKHLAKAEVARRMATSRAQLDRILDPKNDSLSITTLAKIGNVLHCKVHLELVEAA